MTTVSPDASSPGERFANLLLGLYSASELRRTVRFFDDSHKTRYAPQLLELPVTDIQLARNVASLFDATTIHPFLDAMLADRPRRKPDIDAVRALYPRP